MYMTSHANIKGIERSVSCLVQLAQVSQGSTHVCKYSLINRLQLNEELLETNLSTTHSVWHDTILVKKKRLQVHGGGEFEPLS